MKSVLCIFLFVSLFRIVQCAILLVPLPPASSTVVFALALYLLFIPYAYASNRIVVVAGHGEGEAVGTEGGEALRGEVADEGVSEREDRQADVHLPWQFIAHVMLFYFAINIMSSWEVRLISDVARTGLPYFLGSIVSFGLFYGVFVKSGNTSEYWPRMRQITFPLIFLAFLLICLPYPAAYFASVLLAQSAYRFYLLSSYAEMFSICRITKIRARRVFAVTHIALYCGMLLGSFYALSIQQYVPWNSEFVIGTMALVFLCLIVASCWLGTDKQAAKVWGHRVKLTPQGKQNELARRKCQAIAESYRLTSKEEETLLLLVENKKTAAIAERLFVSKNTVRTHIRNLYNKLDIHSREEVCRFFDEYEVGRR